MKIQQKPLEVKYQNLEQYDYDALDEITKQKYKTYSKNIGEFLIVFSELEHALELEIAELIDERAHDEGFIVIKDLEMMEKVELFYNLIFPRVHYVSKTPTKSEVELESLKKSLILSTRTSNGMPAA